ncbi:hypothetical protein ACFYE9_16375 [Rhizobium leguminosarum]|uniref:RelA/SpoT domain-containing protein n=2 Tax=Rhizobium leguminosarum TaxID=384 RepID=A0A154IA25_RHILE|nr:RelA/SpoT domain-containing protein [Rhizobium leguminosarum]KZA97315.1 hypothetical protein A4A59_03870 [Rhizobium leguminosarum]
MKFDEYERGYFSRYEAFAETVRTILDRAIAAAVNIPRPQSIQARAKPPDSLRKRLQEAGHENADVELVRRDLAGVRLIFYTNSDVDRFLSSSIVFDNFTVDRNATKVHYPVEENDDVRYRAVHYTITLNDARALLPEYSDFAGMRCEIQVQTILIHAWAETAHDIIYKTDQRKGFGNAALDLIRKRFERIMDKYLVPAGYEFQRAQSDYERLLTGKALLDQNVLESLKSAEDNNQRHDQLVALADVVLPLYDDVPSVFSEIVDILANVAEAARKTPVRQIETPFGNYTGRSSTEIVLKVVEILDSYRYAAIEEVFSVLLTLYPSETDEHNRKRMIEVIEHLASYNLQVWSQVGSEVQQRLATAIKARGEIPTGARALVVELWRHLLDVEATGTTWSANSISWEFGSIPIGAVAALRDDAIEALFELFRTAVDDVERRDVVNALSHATRTPMRGELTGNTLRRILSDHVRIIDFYAEHTLAISYELRQTIEHAALLAYRRSIDLRDGRRSELDCKAAAGELADALLAMRDRFSEDELYARYKILVGYQGVMPEQWLDRTYDHQKVDAYRNQKIAELLEEVTEEAKEAWLVFLERCASTRSDDLATFPKLGFFIASLAESKPRIADFIFVKANDDLRRFVPGFLNGLIKSADAETYRRNLARFMSEPKSLHLVTMHWKASKPDDLETLKSLLRLSIEGDNRVAVIDCVLYAINEVSELVPLPEEFFRPALLHLIGKRDARWINEAWLPGKTPFFDKASSADVELILESLVECLTLDYQAEQVLAFLSEEHLSALWEFFGRRLEQPQERDDEMRYEAVPHGFQLLAPYLAMDVNLAIKAGRQWHLKDATLFGYRGGKVLSQAFPGLPKEFADALLHLVRDGSDEDSEFVLDVMQNYHGQPATHDVLKEVLIRFPGDERRKMKVARSIENTGVVHGEFGFVDSLRAKKELVASWVEDERPAVANFACELTRHLNRDIADEQRRAEARSALRRIEYENPGGNEIDGDLP